MGLQNEGLHPRKVAREIGTTQDLNLEKLNEQLQGFEHLLTKEELQILARTGIDLTDPFQFAYYLARLKNNFNNKNKSEFLSSLGVELPYTSKRYEMGGAIQENQWELFYSKLKKIENRVKRKRRNIIHRRKKKGVDLFPRKYIYKPKRRLNLSRF
jgi:hypothetical protein